MQPYPVGMEQCPKCEGRTFVIPTVSAVDLGDSPPGTEWCRNCGRRGFVPSQDTQRLLAVLVAAQDSGYLEEAGSWPQRLSWPETG